jgi:MFS family permease
MRKASLGTLFLTVFLDLLGFGLVIPFLPGVARDLGASDLTATLLSAVFSAMQFLFIPLWGRLSDRVGRRPVLLWSIFATALGMVGLALADSLWWLFAARLFTGIATANIAVAQAYIADVTTPETRARGMGILGMAFGLGFILGPFIGGELGQYPLFGREGPLAALVAAGLSVVNVVLAFFVLPESLAVGSRAPASQRPSLRHLGREFSWAATIPGLSRAFVISFLLTFLFSGLEVTLRLFTEDAFGMNVAGTGRLLGVVGLVAAIVQGGLIGRLTPRFGEVRLLVVGTILQAIGFFFTGLSPRLASAGVTVLFLAGGTIAAGGGLANPSLSSYTSRRASPSEQGRVLGNFQALSALGRTLGPAAGGVFYECLGIWGPYVVGGAGMLVASALAAGLPALAVTPAAPAAPGSPDGDAPRGRP